ncbi:MAG: TraB/GumN family protein [Taibaiella sp.]|nr:TraB/GumN family protein [Taibaiella sp.]
MRKLFSFLFLLGSVSSIAQHKVLAKNEQSLLWKITGKGLSKPSYLFGTIHMICSGDYIWTDKMAQCLEKSESVCLEMNIKDPAVMMQVATGMMNLGGKPLKDYFSNEQYALIKAYVHDSLHFDISIAEQMKPVFLLTLLMQKGAGCETPVMYEEKIAEKAISEHKQMDGLEEVSEQLAVLNEIPADTITHQIVAAMKGQSDDDHMYEKMVAAYKAQDLARLYDMIKSSKDITDMGPFLTDRNRKWISRMEGRMMQHSVFFAVGAGHLPGNDGVITLLRKKGYTVEALK